MQNNIALDIIQSLVLKLYAKSKLMWHIDNFRIILKTIIDLL